jgi:hypothetical protein
MPLAAPYSVGAFLGVAGIFCVTAKLLRAALYGGTTRRASLAMISGCFMLIVAAVSSAVFSFWYFWPVVAGLFAGAFVLSVDRSSGPFWSRPASDCQPVRSN